MQELIVTKRRRPPARPLPGAVRAALAAVRWPHWSHLQPGSGCRGEGAELGAAAPRAPTKARAQLPAPLCAFCSAQR